DVPDLDAAIAFYVDGLGLTLRDTPTTGEWARLNGPAGTIHLQRTAARAYSRHWTPVHLDFAVSAIDDAVARARSAGAALEGPIQPAAFGLMATMADPFGHGFCFVALVPAGYACLDEESTP